LRWQRSEKGGAAALEQILAATTSRSPAEIAAIPDDRILAEMMRRIFYAGFSSKVIDNKWPAFEKGFDRFDPNACAFMSEVKFDSLMQDRGLSAPWHVHRAGMRTDEYRTLHLLWFATRDAGRHRPGRGDHRHLRRVRSIWLAPCPRRPAASGGGC
jgi:hypothetical protein